MKKLFKSLNNIRKKDSGQSMVEYGLILALVSIVAIASLLLLGGGISGKFEDVVDAIGGNVPVQEGGNVPGQEGGNVPGQEEVVEVGPVYTDEEIQDLISQGYIEVATAEDLNNVRNNLNGKYIQVADIDLSGIENFEPIKTVVPGRWSTTTNPFTGTFDGGGYVISNLTITKGTDSTYLGLFGLADGATFKNVGLEDVNVTGESYIGGLVGYQKNSSVTNSYATGSVTGTGTRDTDGQRVGGLVGGQHSGSSVSNSYATVTVTSSGPSVGGLVGWQQSSSVTNSYATGTVHGEWKVGGLVGYHADASTITNSYATGSVTGTKEVGGLVGYQYDPDHLVIPCTITNSYYDTDTTGQTSSVGGTGTTYDPDTTGQTSVGGTGKTTAEMKNKDTYVGWDNTIWEIKDGQYPTLR